jgi:hypothetical protein
VRELDAEPDDPARPVVGCDAPSQELRGQGAESMPAEPGRAARADDESTREGTANRFLAGAPLAGHLGVTVTERRTAADCAAQRWRLCDQWDPEATTIRMVLDHGNTPTPASRCAAFAPDEA